MMLRRKFTQEIFSREINRTSLTVSENSLNGTKSFTEYKFYKIYTVNRIKPHIV